MKMRVTTGFIIIAVVAAGMLFTSAGQSETARGQVVIDVLAYGDQSGQEGQDFEDMVADFEAANPGIRIDYELLYDQAYHQKVEARLAANDVPDMAYMWVDALGQAWRDANQFVDHRSFIDPDYYDFDLIDPHDVNGEIYQVPNGTANITSVMYTNTALLAELGLDIPQTYADLVAMVPVAQAAGVEVVALAGAEGWVWNSCVLGTVISRLSGDADWLAKAMEGQYSFTDQVFVDSLAFLKTMVDDGVLANTAILTDYGAALSNFTNSQALFMIDGQWRAGGIEDSQLDPTSVVMLPIPALPGENPAMAGSAAGALSVGYGITRSAYEGDQAVFEAALSFLNFMNSHENKTRDLMEGAIVAPVLKNFVIPSDLPHMSAEKLRFMDIVGPTVGVVDAFVPGEANNFLNTGMQNIVVGRATPQEVAAGVEQRVNR